MRLLLDINIFLDVVFERKGRAASSALISRCSTDFEAWIAWHSLATLFYLIARQTSSSQARHFLSELLGWSQVATTTHQHAVQAMALPMVDVEDAFQAIAAVACGATYIITRNTADFALSPVPALTPEELLDRERSDAP